MLGGGQALRGQKAPNRMKTVPPKTTIAVAMCSQREATLRISIESIADHFPECLN